MGLALAAEEGSVFPVSSLEHTACADWRRSGLEPLVWESGAGRGVWAVRLEGLQTPELRQEATPNDAQEVGSHRTGVSAVSFPA